MANKEFGDHAGWKERADGLAGGAGADAPVFGGETTVESLDALPVFYLGMDEALSDGLAPLLARRGVFFTHLRSAEVFAAAGRPLPPCLLLLDTEMVPKGRTIAQLRDSLAAGGGSQVRLICLARDGDLELRLDALRAGARAFLPLPVDLAAVAGKLLELSRVRRSDQLRVLIVDDEAVAALFAARILQRAGMDTRSVTDPLSVMATIEGFQPDLILMDLYMPSASGAELTTIIREHESFHAIPIVFLSGERDADKQRAALRVGGDEFLAKPVAPESLVAAVEHRVRLFRSTHADGSDAGGRDRMTGLFSRRYLVRRIERVLSVPETGSGHGGLVCIAIDRPRAVVADAGAAGFGDILARVVELLRRRVGERGCAARTAEGSIGLLVEPGAEESVERLAKDLIADVGAANLHAGRSGERISISVGVTALTPSADDALTALLRAERVCAAASQAGGNRVKVAVSGRIGRTPEQVLRHLRQTLATGGFLLLLQPVVSLHGGDGEYHEVQLRLKVGPEELIPPAEFLPVAEMAGLLPEIDRWVMDHVLDILQAHRTDGRGLRLLVPQTLQTLTESAYLQWLGGELVSRMLTELRPIMQFSQTDVIDHLPVTAKRFPALDRLGIPICIGGLEDEPGALKAVEKLPVSLVRLDAGTLARTSGARMTELVAALHAFNTRVVIEEVADSRDIGRAWDCGADFVQGNAIQPPQEGLAVEVGVMPSGAV